MDVTSGAVRGISKNPLKVFCDMEKHIIAWFVWGGRRKLTLLATSLETFAASLSCVDTI